MAVDASSPILYRAAFSGESRLCAVDVLKDIEPYLNGANNSEKLLLQLFAVLTLKGLTAPNKEKSLSFIEEIIQTYDEVTGAASNLKNKSNAIKMYCEHFKRQHSPEIINLCVAEIHQQLQKNQDIENNIVKLIEDIKNLAAETLKLDVTGPNSQKNIDDFRETLLLNFAKVILIAAIFCTYTHSVHILVGPVLGMGLKNPSNSTHSNREKNANRDASTGMQSIFAKHIPPLHDAYLRFAEALMAQHRAWMARGTQEEAEVSGSETQPLERRRRANQSPHANLDPNGNVYDYEEEGLHLNRASPPSNESTPRPNGLAGATFQTSDTTIVTQSNHIVGNIAYLNSMSAIASNTNNNGLRGLGISYIPFSMNDGALDASSIRNRNGHPNHGRQQYIALPIETIASFFAQNRNNRHFHNLEEMLLGLLPQRYLNITGRALSQKNSTAINIQSQSTGPLVPFIARNTGNVVSSADRPPSYEAYNHAPEKPLHTSAVLYGLGIQTKETNTRTIPAAHQSQNDAFEEEKTQASEENFTSIPLQTGTQNTQTKHFEHLEEWHGEALSPIPKNSPGADSHHFATDTPASVDIPGFDENEDDPKQRSLSSPTPSISDESFSGVDISRESYTGINSYLPDHDLAAGLQAQDASLLGDSQDSSFILVNKPATTVNANTLHETQEEGTDDILSVLAKIDVSAAITDPLQTKIVPTSIPDALVDSSQPHDNEEESNSTSDSFSNIYDNYAASEADISGALQEKDKNDNTNMVDTESVPIARIDQPKPSSTDIFDKESNTQEMQDAQQGAPTEAEKLEQSVSTAVSSLKPNDVPIQILDKSSTENAMDQSNTAEDSVSKKTLQDAQQIVQVEAENLKESVHTAPFSLTLDEVFVQTLDQNIAQKTPDQSNTEELYAPQRQTGDKEKNSSSSSARDKGANNSRISVGSKPRTEVARLPKNEQTASKIPVITIIDVDQSSTLSPQIVSNQQDGIAPNRGMPIVESGRNKNNARVEYRPISAIPTANIGRFNVSNIDNELYEGRGVSASSSESDTSFELKRKNSGPIGSPRNKMQRHKRLSETAESSQGSRVPTMDRRQSTVPVGKLIDAQMNSTSGNNFVTDTVLPVAATILPIAAAVARQTAGSFRQRPTVTDTILSAANTAFQASQSKTAPTEKTQRQAPFTVSRHVGEQQTTQASSRAALNMGSLLENNSTESLNSKFSEKKERKPDKGITHTLPSNANSAPITSSPLSPKNKFGFGKKTSPIASERAPVSVTNVNQKTSVGRPPAMQSESNPKAFLNTQTSPIVNRHSSLSPQKENKRPFTASADASKKVKTKTESTSAVATTNKDKKSSTGHTSILSKPPTLEQTSRLALNPASIKKSSVPEALVVAPKIPGKSSTAGDILKTTRFARHHPSASELETSNRTAQQAAQLQASAHAALVKKRSESRPSAGSWVMSNTHEEGSNNAGRTSSSSQAPASRQTNSAPVKASSSPVVVPKVSIEPSTGRAILKDTHLSKSLQNASKVETSNSSAQPAPQFHAGALQDQLRSSVSVGSLMGSSNHTRGFSQYSLDASSTLPIFESVVHPPKKNKFVKRDYNQPNKFKDSPINVKALYNKNMKEVHNKPYTSDPIEIDENNPLILMEISKDTRLLKILSENKTYSVDPGVIFKAGEAILNGRLKIFKNDRFASSDEIEILSVFCYNFLKEYMGEYSIYNDKLSGEFQDHIMEIHKKIKNLYAERKAQEN